jgi:hypothetical protein
MLAAFIIQWNTKENILLLNTCSSMIIKYQIDFELDLQNT